MMNRLFGTVAPIVMLAALGTGCVVSFFTSWSNPWSVLAWGIAYSTVAASTVYFGRVRQETRLMLVGVLSCVLAFVLLVTPGPTGQSAIWRAALAILAIAAAYLIWYRVMSGNWPLGYRPAADPR